MDSEYGGRPGRLADPRADVRWISAADLLIDLVTPHETEHGPVSDALLVEAEAGWPDADH